jgi:hypothetical protein
MSRKRSKSDLAPTPEDVPLTLVQDRSVEINRLHEEFCHRMRTDLDDAIRIGELLTTQKGETEHGQWLPWLEANVRFSQQAASMYMRCFRNRERIQITTSSNLTILDAARLLCDEAQGEASDLNEPESETPPSQQNEPTRLPKVLENWQLTKKVEKAFCRFTERLLPKVDSSQHRKTFELIIHVCNSRLENREFVANEEN